MIPRIIHYCWFGKGEIPARDQKCIESWRKYCPDYSIKQWNESNYDITKNEYMREAYENKKWGFVPDYARLDIIYEHGGIYLDTDVELIRPIDDLLNNKAFMGFENNSLISPGLGFGAEKGSNIIYKIMHGIYDDMKFINEDGSINTTPSPEFNTNILQSMGAILDGKEQVVEGMRIYPQDYFCPRNPNSGELSITENTHSIHWYNGSWLNPEVRKMKEIRWKAIDMFGNKAGKLVTKPVVFYYLTKREIRKMIDRKGEK